MASIQLCGRHSASGTPAGGSADCGASDSGIDAAAVALTVSDVDVDQGVKKPNAAFANRERFAPTPTEICLIWSESTLVSRGEFDQVLWVCSHHISQIPCTTVLSLQGHWGDGNSRSQQSHGKTAESWPGVSQHMVPSFVCFGLSWQLISDGDELLSPFHPSCAADGNEGSRGLPRHHFSLEQLNEPDQPIWL